MSTAVCCDCGKECPDDLDKDMNTIRCEACEKEITRSMIEAEHDDLIANERGLLETNLKAAIGATGNAIYLVKHLSSNQVYDIDYAEGNGDILRLLELACSALVGAQAIAWNLNR